jgi:hypothetical protein
MNAVWLELVLIAHDVIAWTQTLLLSGELAKAAPKRLRYRLLHVAGRLAFSDRQAKLRLAANWPWATDLAAALARLKALPSPPAEARAPYPPTTPSRHSASAACQARATAARRGWRSRRRPPGAAPHVPRTSHHLPKPP